MDTLLIPDVSEWQAPVDFSVFSGPIIVRAHTGWREDHHWRQNAPGAARQPWWGVYQYLPAAVDPADAARAFLAALGPWHPNCTILDLEEGAGDQSARQHAWLEVMATDPTRDWTYSGLYFARDHHLRDVQWIAAYGQGEPTTAHELWQDTNSRAFPGIGVCDGSIFHGTLQDLLNLTGGTADMTDDQAQKLEWCWRELHWFAGINPDDGTATGAGITAIENTVNAIAAQVAAIQQQLAQLPPGAPGAPLHLTGTVDLHPSP